MIHEDEVTCIGCGAPITHLICGPVPEDEDYRTCETCIAERDAYCPDCERPNQFGEQCAACAHEEELIRAEDRAAERDAIAYSDPRNQGLSILA